MSLKIFSLILLATAASAGYLNYNINSRLSPYKYNNYGLATSYANGNLESYGSSKYGGYSGYGYDKYEHDGNLKAYPRYSFNYGVDDDITGDHKSQSEERDGDRVSGRYSLREADGTTRSVEYQANDRDGFNAVVSRVGIAHHPSSYNHDYSKYF
ncbi:Insect cuticle protein [Popillia japonica]|uniref:Insect cuticle protein n=1 Tax=Popillia japonica TaxID=7064 RepID=A0AAW1LWX9_POPJA